MRVELKDLLEFTEINGEARIARVRAYWKWGVGNLVADPGAPYYVHRLLIVVHDMCHAVGCGLDIHDEGFRAMPFVTVGEALRSRHLTVWDAYEIMDSAAFLYALEILGINLGGSRTETLAVIANGLTLTKVTGVAGAMYLEPLLKQHHHLKSERTATIARRVAEEIYLVGTRGE